MTKKTYKLGQPVRVIVAGTDRLLRTVDFVLERELRFCSGRVSS